MRRFLIKKAGDCGSPPTPKKLKADAERLATAKGYEERRRRGFKAAWRDEFAWLTYDPVPTATANRQLPVPSLQTVRNRNRGVVLSRVIYRATHK